MAKAAKPAPYAGPERRLARPSPTMIAMAVFGLAAIAFMTLCPLRLRPTLGDAGADRFCAYLVLGGLIAFASGRRVLAATAAVMAVAVVLEAAQLVVPGRDARVADAVMKALGGVIGVTASQVRWPLQRLMLRIRTNQSSPQDRTQASPARYVSGT